jgi:hypothetical protein
VGVVAFWLLYACAALYQAVVPGELDPVSAMAAAGGFTPPSSPVISSSGVLSQAPAPRVITTGDLVVLMALAGIVAALSATFIVARREVRGPGRQPGMGAGDDPLWISGELEPVMDGRAEP